MHRVLRLKINLAFLLAFLFLPVCALAQGTQQQTIRFLPVADHAVNSAPFQVVALSSAYLPVTLSVQGPASLNGRLLTLTGIGTVTVTAQQAGNTAYAATSAQLSFQSTQVTPVVSLSSLSVPYGTQITAAQLQASATAAPIVDSSADMTTVSSQLNTSVLLPGMLPNYLANSPVFRYEGSNVGPSPYQNDNGGYIATSTPYPYGLNFQIAFTCDCQQFELAIQARQASYRLWVDGAYTSPDSTALVQSYPNPEFILVKFPDKHPRQIKITNSGNAPFFGIYTVNGDTISAPQVPVGPPVMIFGDSWVGPTVVPPALPPAQPGVTGSGFPQTLGEFFNWDYWDDGVGGSGFTNPGTDALGRTFVQRIETDLCPYSFKAVVLFGGTNDGGSSEAAVQAAVSQSLSEIHACEPGVPIYLYGPQNADQPAVDQGMAAAVAADPGPVSYTDIGLDGWIYGSSTDPSTGNAYLYLNAHPTPLGHDFVAEMIASDLIGKFPDLFPQPHTLLSPVALAGAFAYQNPVGTAPAVGNYTLSATFMPQDTTNFASATATGTLTVTQATTTTTVAVSLRNQVATLTATVAPQVSGTPSGTVTFFNGGRQLAAVPLANGGAATQLSFTALSAGTQSITASYSGDGNFLPSSTQAPVTFLNTAPDFSFALSQSQLTLPPGSSGSLQLAVSPLGGLTGPLSVQCAGLPQNTTCALANAPVLNGSALAVTLMVQAFVPRAALRQQPGHSRWQQFGGGTALCCLFGSLPLWRRRRTWARCAVLLAAFALSVAGGGLLTGCGSTSAIQYAAPGTYAVQVSLTANAGTAGAETHMQALTLTLP